MACECELVLEPVCVDLGVGVTFPAPNACIAECLALPIAQDLGTVQSWDAVELSCDLALLMARSDQGQDWVTLEVTGLTVAVPR